MSCRDASSCGVLSWPQVPKAPSATIASVRQRLLGASPESSSASRDDSESLPYSAESCVRAVGLGTETSGSISEDGAL